MNLRIVFVSMNSSCSIRYISPHFNLFLSHHLCKVTLVLINYHCFKWENRKTKLWFVCDSYSIAKNGVEVQCSKVWCLPHDPSSLQWCVHSPSCTTLSVAQFVPSKLITYAANTFFHVAILFFFFSIHAQEAHINKMFLKLSCLSYNKSYCSRVSCGFRGY